METYSLKNSVPSGKTTSSDFMKFFEGRIKVLRDNNRYGTALNYQRAKKTLEKFIEGQSLTFHKITPAFIDAYEEYLFSRGMIKNSVSFHLRILRAVYNKGVKRGFLKQTFPFREAYTGIDKTRKRHISIDIIRELSELDLPSFTRLSIARDMFLFSFFTRGMAFVDMSYLRKTDIIGNEIIYIRKKSRSLLKIKIEKPIRKLIEQYSSLNPESPYLFPVLEEDSTAETHKRYLRELSQYNHQLKRLSKKLGLSTPLSSYTSRHTWAFQIYKMEVPVSVISAALGHTSEKVTRIYLDSLDNSLIDKANNKLINKLLKSSAGK